MNRQEATLAPLSGAAVENDNEHQEFNSTNMALGSGLAIVAAASHSVELRGAAANSPIVIETVVNSSAHLLLGFAGAWTGYLSQRYYSSKNRLRTAAIGLGATVGIDFAVEKAQDVVNHASEAFYVQPNIAESGRDLGFAIGGYALTLAINHFKN